jgi:hypothetical protein
MVGTPPNPASCRVFFGKRSLTAKDAEAAKERKSLTAKDAEAAKERNGLTAKDAKIDLGFARRMASSEIKNYPIGLYLYPCSSVVPVVF